MSAEVPWPAGKADYEGAFYRRSRVECVAVEKVETVAGHSASGETGWAHMARCRLADGGMADVGLGWSRNPQAMEWAGGQVGGFVGPYRDGVKLVAAAPQAGLEQLAAALKAQGLGLILDIVPNHLAADPRSPAWADVPRASITLAARSRLIIFMFLAVVG
mgnify:CR=1 FL=1